VAQNENSYLRTLQFFLKSFRSCNFAIAVSRIFDFLLSFNQIDGWSGGQRSYPGMRTAETAQAVGYVFKLSCVIQVSSREAL